MYPIHDVDAQLLLATLIASKRRAAELVEIVAAAEFLGYPIKSASQWAETLNRLSTHGLIAASDGGHALTPPAQAMVSGLPKKADGDERVFLLREKLSAYKPAELGAGPTASAEQFEEAMRAHAATARQGGKNLLMPKPKADEDAPRRSGGRRPFAGGRRR